MLSAVWASVAQRDVQQNRKVVRPWLEVTVKKRSLKPLFAIWIGLSALFLTACAEPGPDQFLGPNGRAALDVVLRSAVASGDVPGVVAMVVDRESILYRNAFGVMDADGDEAMRPDAIFQIFSMTKPITSVGIMILREEGLVELDAAASTYLPELEGREVLVGFASSGSAIQTRPAARPITIRDLLRHTSGFGYAFSNSDVLALASRGIPDWAHPIVHDPGARWTYGMGPAFLGRIIEEVSGQPLPDFLESRIFGPLGMTDTSFSLNAEDSGRLVATYQRVNGELRGQPGPDEYGPTIRGDYGLLSTADDYARFLQAILGLGERSGVRLLADTSVGEMARNQLPGIVVSEQVGAMRNLSLDFPLGAGQDGFGLGFQVAVGESAGGRPPGSLSWAGLQNTHFWVDPHNEIAVILLLQILPFYDEKVIELLLSFERALYAQVQ